MGRSATGALVVLGAWSLGCSLSASSSPPTDDGTLDDGTGGDCLDQDPDGDDARLVIEATESSYHEMVVCGGLANQLARDLNLVLVTSLLDAQGVELPIGYRYDGEGGYVSGGQGSEMVIHYAFGRDYAAFAEGERVVPNLFDLDSYLRGVRPGIDFSSGDVLVHWDAKGPLVELLGKGADPPNPIRMSVRELENPTHLQDLSLDATVEVVDAEIGATVTYSLETRSLPIRALLGGDPLVFDLVGSDTLAEDGSRLTASSPGVDYNDGPGTLTGEVAFELRDGPVDVDGTYVYEDSSAPTTTFVCP